MVVPRTILVLLSEDPESLHAVAAACRLAAADGGSIVGVFVIEVPTALPLEAHMFDVESHAREALGRAREMAEAHGLRFSGRLVRAHGVAEAIVGEAERLGADLIVLATHRRAPRRQGRPIFDEVVRAILADAPCRVSVIAAPQAEEASVAPR